MAKTYASSAVDEQKTLHIHSAGPRDRYIDIIHGGGPGIDHAPIVL
jgi:hypothetical protein